MILTVVNEKSRHAMTPVDPCVVYGSNRHAMTLAVVHEKNRHAMALVDPCVVHEKNTSSDTGGSLCGS